MTTQRLPDVSGSLRKSVHLSSSPFGRKLSFLKSKVEFIVFLFIYKTEYTEATHDYSNILQVSSSLQCQYASRLAHISPSAPHPPSLLLLPSLLFLLLTLLSSHLLLMSCAIARVFFYYCYQMELMIGPWLCWLSNAWARSSLQIITQPERHSLQLCCVFLL